MYKEFRIISYRDLKNLPQDDFKNLAVKINTLEKRVIQLEKFLFGTEDISNFNTTTSLFTIVDNVNGIDKKALQLNRELIISKHSLIIN